MNQPPASGGAGTPPQEEPVVTPLAWFDRTARAIRDRALDANADALAEDAARWAAEWHDLYPADAVDRLVEDYYVWALGRHGADTAARNKSRLETAAHEAGLTSFASLRVTLAWIYGEFGDAAYVEAMAQRMTLHRQRIAIEQLLINDPE